ncbi:rhodoquinone biosynthesis methyltransferase RquA [Thauera sinica]|uniref:Rhodoquinone biosynthesis methyltransferase RquA n=1 Tax=Thauera sinica TaxID=2665146 RepID=A0ABW1AXF0_9RHOO|nr:rhodoquinone biosynthesis methyltransferase RquA [Thauera sp. K11]ATE61197.1 methyltransferase [Thauera sp. K11]
MNDNPDAIAPVYGDPATPAGLSAPGIPAYLQKVYWWAYLHPNAVRVFEREWLVNLILWGNFRRLRDAALAELGERIGQQVLQIACVYGDFTQRIAARLHGEGRLDVVDVAPIQLANLRRKLGTDVPVRLHRQDSSALQFPDASVDAALLFFLLHEQPEDVRRASLAEALRVTRPGGKVIIVDYHRPARWHPLRWPMRLVLRTLEPFALDLWRHDVAHYLPQGIDPAAVTRTTAFGGLYQKVVIVR